MMHTKLYHLALVALLLTGGQQEAYAQRLFKKMVLYRLFSSGYFSKRLTPANNPYKHSLIACIRVM